MAAMNFNRWVARFVATYRNSAARRFLSWWGGELATFLPARLREWFVERRDEVLLSREESGWLLRRSDAPDQVETLSLEAGAEELRALAERMQRSGETTADIVSLLPRGDFLERRLSLPMAAEENLAQVIAFELDRQTPFRADQVRCDFRIARRDPVAKLLYVDVLLAPRTRADDLTTPLAAAGIALQALDGRDGNGNRLGFNLLPAEARAQRTNSALRLNLVLGAACLVLLVTVMQRSVAGRAQALEALQAEVDAVRVEAKQTAKLNEALDEAIEGANFLASRKQDHPVTINILRELTDRLPKHTALVRLSVNRGEIQIQGNSDEAASLIAILQPSTTLQGPALQGAITPDARTRKEQFLIQARARKIEQEGANAAAPKS